MEEEVEQRRGKLEWFLYMIFFPLLFTVVLSGVLLQFLGYNVSGKLLQWGNSVPYVEKVVPGSNEKPETAEGPSKEAQQLEEYERTIEELNLQLSQEQSTIVELEGSLKEKEAEIQALNDENIRLKQQSEEAQKEQDQRKEVAGVYTSMSPSKAAPILEQMPMEQALKILKLLNREERGAILAKLDPKKAATMTTELLKSE